MDQTLIETAEEIRRLVRRVYKMLDRNAGEQAQQGGMTIPQTRVIEVLYSQPGLSLKEMSQELEMAHSTISGIMDRLEAMDCILRKQDATDKRITRHYLTDHVRDYINHILPGQLSSPIAQALSKGTPDEIETIKKGLEILHRLMNDNM